MPDKKTWDFVVIGSGFGGSVSARRLVEKGYDVLVLERGKRYQDHDFAHSNRHVNRFFWMPSLRWYGIQQITPLSSVVALHGSGVGGGSLMYANVLLKPDDRLFDSVAWRHLADWRSVLAPHYEAARRMLGVTQNPYMEAADFVLQDIAADSSRAETFRPTEVGVFFGEPGREGEIVHDPYFDGEGPPRAGCKRCGGCMVGCRYNAKNTLLKNYLYFAEKEGAHIQAESEVVDIRPLSFVQPDDARYEVVYRRSTAWPFAMRQQKVRARHVVIAAGTIGTMRLLFRCREKTGSLSAISPRLGDRVRTNSEALLGSVSRDRGADYAKGIAITSIFHPDEVTSIEPVRYPDGFSVMRTMTAPLIESGGGIPQRVIKLLWEIAQRPRDFVSANVLPPWASRTTILLVMQTDDNMIRFRWGRDPFTLYREGLVSDRAVENPVPIELEVAHRITRAFARRTNGVPQGSINENLLNIPLTAHILGGCPFGRSDSEGVIDLNCEVFNYPGLYVVDGSIVPANPGVNPSLTIAALAEYAMNRIKPA